MATNVGIKVVGRGWTQFTFAVDDATIELRASYLSDAVDDLIRATRAVLTSCQDQTAIFIDEPGEHRLKLRPNGDRLGLTVLVFPESYSHEGDMAGKLVFEAECRLKTFAGAVLSAAQGLFDEHGLRRYHDLWNYEFPAGPMKELRAALRAS